MIRKKIRRVFSIILMAVISVSLLSGCEKEENIPEETTSLKTTLSSQRTDYSSTHINEQNSSSTQLTHEEALSYDIFVSINSEYFGITYDEFSDEYSEIEVFSDKISLSDIAYSENLKRLTVSKLKTDNLNGIENFPNLEYLALDDVCIKDISALSKLKKLETIWIHFTDTVEDYSVLCNLENLKEFTAILCEDGSTMPNIEAIAYCPKLEKLFLQGFTIDNIEFIENLKSLKMLRLWSYKNPITDISPLSGLGKLEELEITYYSDDIKLLGDMVSLQRLSIDRDPKKKDEENIETVLSDMLPECEININY